MSAKTTAQFLQSLIDIKLTAHAARTLTFLGSEGRTPIAALSFGYTPSGIGGTIDRLAKRGLVVREIDPNNTKVVHVILTKEGVKVAKRLWAAAA